MFRAWPRARVLPDGDRQALVVGDLVRQPAAMRLPDLGWVSRVSTRLFFVGFIRAGPLFLREEWPSVGGW